jgi:MHS family proline/betaine transporter-like MFS transporter
MSTLTQTVGGSSAPNTQNRKLIMANLVGTMLEIYDMSIYGYFAPLIAANFFPSSSKAVALLNTLAVFMVSFIVRPIGAIIFGHIGDTIGRKQTLILTILLISFATCGIGLLPNATQIGIYAPIFLVIFRIIQGLSFSGE